MVRFVADCNVGRLARWLRALGFDASYEPRIGDAELVAWALAEDRVLLTRDAGLVHRRVVSGGAVRAILLRDGEVGAQLRQVLAALGGRPREGSFLTRCLECNAELLPRRKEEVAERLPPHVRRVQERFSQCPACLRVYWPGSHWARMRERIAAL